MRLLLFKIFLILFHISASSVYADSVKNTVKKADSLFMLKKWDDSFFIYSSVFDSSKTYSTNLLLKMAYISEQQGDVAKELFYLCTLYRHHPNSNLLKKISSVAEQGNLKGYSYSEIEYFISLYKQHYTNILIVAIVLSLLFSAYLFYRKYRGMALGYRPLLFLIFLSVFYFISNYSLIPPRAIINKNNCLLMDEPSGASQVKAIIDLGHRITVIAKSDIWYLINWGNQRLYIKETDLLIIPENQPYFF